MKGVIIGNINSVRFIIRVLDFKMTIYLLGIIGSVAVAFGVQVFCRNEQVILMDCFKMPDKASVLAFGPVIFLTIGMQYKNGRSLKLRPTKH